MMVDEPILDEPTEHNTFMEVSAPTWTDIDEYDHHDPQAVTAYVEDIFDNCRQKEVRFEARNSLIKIFSTHFSSATPVSLFSLGLFLPNGKSGLEIVDYRLFFSSIEIFFFFDPIEKLHYSMQTFY